MAVFTTVKKTDVFKIVCSSLGCSDFSISGILSGTENSNFLITTDSSKKYILTIFEERVNVQNLQFYLNFTKHLKGRGINCPTNIKITEEEIKKEYFYVKSKPAIIINFLEGNAFTNENISLQQCRAAGKQLAQMHKSALTFNEKQNNILNIDNAFYLISKVRDRLSEICGGLDGFIENVELEINSFIKNKLQQQGFTKDLPCGVIHGDYFPDNVFFSAKKDYIGVIDFYFACNDYFIYDISIAINSWCANVSGEYNDALYNNFLLGYQDVRPLTAAETTSIGSFLLMAAYKFFASRAYDWFYKIAKDIKLKDPMEYVRKMQSLRTQSFKLKVTTP